MFKFSLGRGQGEDPKRGRGILASLYQNVRKEDRQSTVVIEPPDVDSSSLLLFLLETSQVVDDRLRQSGPTRSPVHLRERHPSLLLLLSLFFRLLLRFVGRVVPSRRLGTRRRTRLRSLFPCSYPSCHSQKAHHGSAPDGSWSGSTCKSQEVAINERSYSKF